MMLIKGMDAIIARKIKDHYYWPMHKWKKDKEYIKPVIFANEEDHQIDKKNSY